MGIAGKLPSVTEACMRRPELRFASRPGCGRVRSRWRSCPPGWRMISRHFGATPNVVPAIVIPPSHEAPPRSPAVARYVAPLTRSRELRSRSEAS